MNRPRFHGPRVVAASALTLAASFAAGCASSGGKPDAPRPPPSAASSAADNHKIIVSELTERLELPATSGALDADSLAALEDFAKLHRTVGRGPFAIQFPQGGENETSAQALARQARLRAAEAGLSFSQIPLSAYDATGEAAAPVVITFSRFEAGAPDCAPIWAQDLASASDNRPYSSFGCATQSNLAAMVADPADLVAPRAEEPADAARRQATLDRYRQGEPTHATRSGDERVSISTAVR